MGQPSRAERVARVSVYAAVLAVAVTSSLCRVGLFADGAYFMLEQLADAGLFVGNPHRSFVTAVNESPVLLAMGLGVRDVSTLTYVQSAGLVLIPGACWFTALWLQRGGWLFWWFTLLWASVYLSVGLFAVSESVLTYALVALSASLSFRYADTGRTAYLAMIVPLGVVLLRSYELMLLLGPVVGGVVLVSARRAGGGRRDTWLTAVVVALLVGSAALSLVAVLDPDNPGGAALSLNPLTLLLDPRVLLSLLGLVAFVGSGAVDPSRPASRAALGVAAGATLLLTISVTQVSPAAYFDARLAVGCLEAVVLAAAARTHFARTWRPAPLAWVVPVGLVVVLASMLVVTSLRFDAWLDRYRGAVRSSDGLVPFEEAGIPEEFAWPWTNPTLSVILQSRPDDGIILNPEPPPAWEPFEPTDPLRPRSDFGP